MRQPVINYHEVPSERSHRKFYHGNGDARRNAAIADRTVRRFIVWDGEGATETPGTPQDYILFGCFTGTGHRKITGKSLSTKQCLDLMLTVAADNPACWHVGFAFDYDVNMILRDLTPTQYQELTKTGKCWFMNYKIEHVSNKWITVFRPATKTKPYGYIKIYNVWGFFQSSLVAALKANISDHPLMVHLPEIEAGKDARSGFTHADLDMITRYWEIENELCHALVNRLRDHLYAVGLHISSWHGPGAIASYVYRANRVQAHKKVPTPRIYDCARRAYAGGRFEQFRIGRCTDVYSYDINSAYPDAISQLPSLSDGVWQYVVNPRRVVDFGIYRVQLGTGDNDLLPFEAQPPSPLFHRKDNGTVAFPWRTNGWYWSPEVKALQELVKDHPYRITEAWEYVGWKTRPFEFVRDVYAQRRAMKDRGDGAQMALKLALNSLYGKMAQRAGWERTGGPPKWHQLEWAGWVTSYTRAKLYRMMCTIPYDQLIAVETDGIYTTATPDSLGVTNSKELGEWEINEYDEIIYLQSGFYAKRSGNKWSFAIRGYDRNSLGATADERAKVIINFCQSMIPFDHGTGMPREYWPKLPGTTTRFIGYRNALWRETQNRGPMKQHHRVWETQEKELDTMRAGKRRHALGHCDACRNGNDAYEQAHDTKIWAYTLGDCIRIVKGDDLIVESARHDIPWLPYDCPEWVAYEQSIDDLHATG
jgi:hypothetical protein